MSGGPARGRAWVGNLKWWSDPGAAWAGASRSSHTRARSFSTARVASHADYDQQVNEKLRFVQLAPPGSACSIAIGTGLIDSEPGILRNLQIVVEDVAAARQQLLDRGVVA